MTKAANLAKVSKLFDELDDDLVPDDGSEEDIVEKEQKDPIVSVSNQNSADSDSTSSNTCVPVALKSNKEMKVDMKKPKFKLVGRKPAPHNDVKMLSPGHKRRSPEFSFGGERDSKNSKRSKRSKQSENQTEILIVKFSMKNLKNSLESMNDELFTISKDIDFTSIQKKNHTEMKSD